MANDFWTILNAEIGVAPAFLIHQQGGFDALTMLESGEQLFPASLASKVPSAIFDAKEAAKALAYELPTACGFHTFRALESVVRVYLKQFNGSKPEPEQRNLGVLINALSEKGGDPKVIAALQQIKDLHRNPVAHPEVNLDLEEAISVMGMTRSVMGAMLAELPVFVEPPSQSATSAS